MGVISRIVLLTATTAAAAGVPVAVAGSRDSYGNGVEYARVTSVTPVYRDVRVSSPRQECWDEAVDYDDRYSERDGYWNGYRYDTRTAGTVIGAIAGGVAGHQFGGGRGKDVATVVGALIGAGIGRQVAANRTEPRYQDTAYEQRCRTVGDSYYEQQVDGYDVTYRYNGRIYTTRTREHPGERIPVHVDVRPVAY